MTAQEIKNTNNVMLWQLLASIARILTKAKDHTAYIGRGRSCNTATWRSAPLVIVSGKSGPKLCGQPYLKTNFQGKGGFQKTLYTPSTLCIEVGADWIPFAKKRALSDPKFKQMWVKLTAELL